jgi:hypothetical protein
MRDIDTAHVNYLVNNPIAHAVLTGILGAFTPNSPVPMFSHEGYDWDVTFSIDRKHAKYLRVATLRHDRLKVVLREQNPVGDSESAQLARAGYRVYQLHVNDQPRVRIIDGEGEPFDGRPTNLAQQLS